MKTKLTETLVYISTLKINYMYNKRVCIIKGIIGSVKYCLVFCLVTTC